MLIWTSKALQGVSRQQQSRSFIPGVKVKSPKFALSVSFWNVQIQRADDLWNRQHLAVRAYDAWPQPSGSSVSHWFPPPQWNVCEGAGLCGLKLILKKASFRIRVIVEALQTTIATLRGCDPIITLLVNNCPAGGFSVRFSFRRIILQNWKSIPFFFLRG